MNRALYAMSLFEEHSDNTETVLKYVKRDAELIRKWYLPRISLHTSKRATVVLHKTGQSRESYIITYHLDEPFDPTRLFDKTEHMTDWYWSLYAPWASVSLYTNRNVIGVGYLNRNQHIKDRTLILMVDFSITREQKHTSRFFYHTTDRSLLSQILKQGLRPNRSSHSTEYSHGRVFVTQDRQTRQEAHIRHADPILLKIDKRKLTPGTITYGHTKGGELVMEKTIPPSAITVEELP